MYINQTYLQETVLSENLYQKELIQHFQQPVCHVKDIKAHYITIKMIIYIVIYMYGY